MASSLVDVSEIEVYIEGLSTDTDNQAPMIQIGDSGGLETSGYTGLGWSNSTNHQTSNNSAGYFASDELVFDSTNTGTFFFKLYHMGSNIWAFNCNGSIGSGALMGGAGLKTLTGILDRVTITTSGGSAVFDAGTAHARSR